MVNLQRDHNEKVHPQWDRQGYRFTRAIWIECAELIEHFGWKWWKHQEPDLEQVELELVDIWHFGLSALMIEHRERVVEEITSCVYEDTEDDGTIDFREAVEKMAAIALSGTFSVAAFLTAMRALPMSFEKLYVIYVGKNVLNVFRQENGYKDGSYQKTWFGREDNEHLAELAQSLDIGSESFMAELRQLLNKRYAEVQAN